MAVQLPLNRVSSVSVSGGLGTIGGSLGNLQFGTLGSLPMRNLSGNFRMRVRSPNVLPPKLLEAVQAAPVCRDASPQANVDKMNDTVIWTDIYETDLWGLKITTYATLEHGTGNRPLLHVKAAGDPPWFETCRTCRFWAAASQRNEMAGRMHVAPCLRAHSRFSPYHTQAENSCAGYKEATFGHLDDQKARIHYNIVEGSDDES